MSWLSRHFLPVCGAVPSTSLVPVSVGYGQFLELEISLVQALPFVSFLVDGGGRGPGTKGYPKRGMLRLQRGTVAPGGRAAFQEVQGR